MITDVTPANRLPVLHALRLSGFLTADRIARRTGLAQDVVDAELTASQRHDLVRERTGRISGWSLTPDGRTAHALLLADELERHDARAAVEHADERFVALNEPFKRICTRWQLRENDGGTQVNDHTDADYDTRVAAELTALHQHVVPVLHDLTGALTRFGRYEADFSTALVRLSGGDRSAFAAPMSQSYHDTWMELHQDLLSTLGRQRAAADGT